MSLFRLAKQLKNAGLSNQELRIELRCSITPHGEFPTNSAVEEAIAFANKPFGLTQQHQPCQNKDRA